MLPQTKPEDTESDTGYLISCQRGYHEDYLIKFRYHREAEGI